MNKTEATSEIDNHGGRQYQSAFLGHTKCPSSYLDQITCSPGSGPEGFFGLGDLRLYGRTSGGATSPGMPKNLSRIDSLTSRGNGSVALPFDPTEIIDNLRLEKYVGAANAEISYIADSKSLSRRIYYALRPLFPVRVRRILQRIALQDWSKIPFPAWPVDTTVEDFINWLWVLVLEATGEEQIPFIWYWPDSFTSCAIMTHDVETGAGQDFCPTILKMEQEFGIRSSFELVPEVRYEISQDVMEAIRKAGSEICVHGLNHDGRLFSSEELFRTRAMAINEYAKKWGANGFRSPVMYRNFAWYDAFKFSYDMSVPNVAHLDPQRGGCCTIFPFFVGDIVELPLTTTQDYPLYNIMRSDPMTMWTKQMDSIVAKHGLVSFIIHPDYTVEQERQDIYRELLQMLKRNGDEKKVWLALPGEVDTWWRERNGLTLTREGGTWSVRGKGSDRASVAYAKLENGKLAYVLPNGTTEKV
jgi:peptidoglycan/xylan/chitin deacetylase (PgdA/CDA1 family)